MESIYLVEQIEVHRARILSAHATPWLAQKEVERIISAMPQPDIWRPDSCIKRGSPNHGEAILMWTSRITGPTSRQVTAFAVVKLPINHGEIVARLSELI
jgi:hypothetical protein